MKSKFRFAGIDLGILRNFWYRISVNLTHDILMMCHLNLTGLHIQLHVLLTHSGRIPPKIYSKEEKPLFIHRIGNTDFLHFSFINNTTFCVDKIKYEHLAILSYLKSCQFTSKILVIFNIFLCCQFEDLHIILPKTIPMSQGNIELWQMRPHFLHFFLSFLWYIIQNI